MEIVVAKEILKANDQIAAGNRKKLDDAKVYTVNVLGSPGSGKTTLMEALAKKFNNRIRAGVVEGDLATAQDAERMEKAGLPVVQINTGGGCHLEAGMVANALDNMDLEALDLMFIDNVGNLVCTAGYSLGEQYRLVVLSVAEGDDKVSKYPPMFQRADIVLLNKMDMLELTDFDINRVKEDVKKLNPNAIIMEISARTMLGISELTDKLIALQQEWLESING